MTNVTQSPESYSVPALLRAIEEHRNPTYFPGCHYVDQILERAAEIFASTDGVSGQRCECCDALGLHDCPANPKTRAAELTASSASSSQKVTDDMVEAALLAYYGAPGFTKRLGAAMRAALEAALVLPEPPHED